MRMSKVVLTKEQAEAIETLKKEKSFREIIKLNLHANTWGGTYVEKPKRIIVKMNFDDLIKALYIGYEVKPEFKVGDWVYHQSDGIVSQITRVNFNKLVSDAINTDGHKGWISCEDIRHATSEEIKQEKERRWWEKHGREVWELKEGDILVETALNFPVEIHKVDDYVWFSKFDNRPKNVVKETHKVVCFVEQRLDREEA